jgi:hypothetical protein
LSSVQGLLCSMYPLTCLTSTEFLGSEPLIEATITCLLCCHTKDLKDA